jgi:hypothetical protein
MSDDVEQSDGEIGELFEVLVVAHGTYSTFYIAGSEYPKLNAAWHEFVERGRMPDKLLELDTESGSTIEFAISAVVSIEHSTRESRRAWRLRNEAFKSEQRADIGYEASE